MDNAITAQVSSGKLGTIVVVCAGLLVVVVLLTLASLVAASFMMPQKYFSKVTMELPGEGSSSAGLLGPSAAPRKNDPQYVQAQFEILQKTEILYPVIERLDLTREYASPGTTISQAEAYKRLRTSMKLQEVRNTQLIEIGISDTDPQRAANIANAIAITYQEAIVADGKRNVEKGLEPAKAEVETQQKKFKEALRLATEIRERNGITDSAPEEESAVLAFTADTAAPNGAPEASADDKIAAKAKMTEYVNAKQQALQERKTLEQEEVSYVAAKMTATQLPRAKIWEKAEKADYPQNRIATLLESIRH